MHYDEQREEDIDRMLTTHQSKLKPRIRVLTDKCLVARTCEKMKSGIEIREVDDIRLAYDLAESMC